MEAPLTTHRLRLRRLRADDLDRLVELDGDPEVMRYLSGGAPTPREVVAERVLPGFLQRDRQRPHLGVWAIEPLETEASASEPEADPPFLGWVSLRPLRDDDLAQARLGYRLHRAAWGHGYAAEAAWSLLELGFSRGDLQRVEATTYERNLASQRVLEKLGLRLQRRYRPTVDELAASGSFGGDDAEVWDGDELVYGIDRAGWRGRAG